MPACSVQGQPLGPGWHTAHDVDNVLQRGLCVLRGRQLDDDLVVDVEHHLVPGAT